MLALLESLRALKVEVVPFAAAQADDSAAQGETMLLPQAETLTLFVIDQGGESWSQRGDGCGPHKLGSTGGARRGAPPPPACAK
jgi:hypothetical protein